LKRKYATLIFVAMMASMLVIPQASAATSQDLFYRPEDTDRFYFTFELIGGGTPGIDEIIYMEIDDASTPVPDPLSNLTELSYLTKSFYYENGSSMGIEVLIFLLLPHLEYPVGNWSLINTLAATDLEPLFLYEARDLTFEQDEDYWGYSYVTNSSSEDEFTVMADFSKFDGVIYNYNIEAVNTTSDEVLGVYNVNRFSYHNMRWGFDEGDIFNFHLITTGNDLGLENLEEDMVLEVAEEGMVVIPYDCSNFGDIPYFGASMEWMNGSAVVDPYFIWTLKIAVPIGNWTLLGSFIEDLSVSYDEMAVDPADIYFWGYSWKMTTSDLLYEVHTDYLKIDGMVARHTMTITNTTSSEVIGTISIERFDLEPYTDRIAPAVNSPDDVNFVAGTTDHNITWTLSDENPTTYQVLVNGTVEASGSWTSGTEIVLDLDDFEAGVYNCTIVVYDIAGNQVMDSVIVTVTAPGGGIIDLLMDNILFIAIGVGAVVIIGAVVIMRRRS